MIRRVAPISPKLSRRNVNNHKCALLLANAVGCKRTGQAYAMQGDKAKARQAYHDFQTLWKDADPDIPIFKQAKAEYAKLQ